MDEINFLVRREVDHINHSPIEKVLHLRDTVLLPPRAHCLLEVDLYIANELRITQKLCNKFANIIF